MSKERTTVSLDPDVLREVRSRPEFNLSGFLNRALRTYFFGSDASPNQAAMTEQQRELERRLADLDERRDAVREELDRMEEAAEVQEAVKSDLEASWEEAEDVLLGDMTDPDRLCIGNPAVENWANRLGVPQAHLLEELGVEVT